MQGWFCIWQPALYELCRAIARNANTGRIARARKRVAIRDFYTVYSKSVDECKKQTACLHTVIHCHVAIRAFIICDTRRRSSLGDKLKQLVNLRLGHAAFCKILPGTVDIAKFTQLLYIALAA